MGTEEFWVPAVISAIGAAGQAVNQSNAQKRSNNAEVQAINDQQQYREQANSQVKNLTQQIAQNNPQQIAAKETGDFVNTLRKNAAGSAAPGATGGGNTNYGAPVSALGAVNGTSSRYKADTANAQKEVQDYGQTNAEEMSAVDAAVRQRQNEGLAMQSLGTNLNTLGAESQTKGWADQLRAAAAGTASPWANMFSTILQRGANAYSKNPNMFDGSQYVYGSTPGANAAGEDAYAGGLN